MKKLRLFCLIVLLASGLVSVSLAFAQSPPEASLKTARKPNARKLSAAELEGLGSPIALYPDVLLEQMLPAATFPEQIVDAALLIKNKEDAKQIPKQSWDRSVMAIAYYPGVLKMMYEKLTWTTSLGEAFLNQPKDLLGAIQRLRARAQQHGNLKTNEQQKVTTTSTAQGETIILVEPASPQVIYVPQTTSTVVYTQPEPSTADTLAPLATFGLGMAIGAAMADDDDDYYHGYAWGPSGIWVSGNSYNNWYNARQNNVARAQNQAADRQNFRQGQASQRQDFRQGWAKDNPGQAQQYRNQRQQQAQQRYNTSKDQAAARRSNFQSSPSYQNRQSQYSGNRQQQLDTARKDMQSRDWSTGSASARASSRGYAGHSGGYGGSRSAFGGVQSGSRARTYSSRGGASRSRAGSYGGRSYGGSRSFGGRGGGRRGGGGRRR